MPRKVKATRSDTLCSIAIRLGFLNCDPLRALPANNGMGGRQLRVGEEVTVPTVTPGSPGSASTGSSASLKVKTSPIPRLRFVHGSPDLPAARDRTLDRLEISNFPTDKAGDKYKKPFKDAFGFDAQADLDPDAFKVELGLRGSAASVNVVLQALKPLYGTDGKVTGHTAFVASDASDHADRKMDLECQGSPGQGLYRSRYLRLVTDDKDKAAAPTQTLLVTDIADGNGGAKDQVEILDQRIRASIAYPGCKAPAAELCQAVAELPVGNRPKRARIAVHVFRAERGMPTMIAGLTEQHVRLRMFKWFRRAYAQACIAPKLVAAIDLVDPPTPDMLVVSEDTGDPASGVAPDGSASTITFTLGMPPRRFDAVRRIFDSTATVRLKAGQTPAQVCAAIGAALPAGYGATVYPNPPDFTAADGSCDVIVAAIDGHPVMLRGLSCNDTKLTVKVAAVDLSAVDIDSGKAFMAGAAAHRRVLRAATRGIDRLDYFIVERLGPGKTRGIASVPGKDLPLRFQPGPSLSWAVLMGCRSTSGPVMDGGANLPFTMPHESGHVLNDAFHTDIDDPAAMPEANTEMMRTGTTPPNTVGATKRICDSQTVKYQMFKAAPAAPAAPPPPGTFDSQAISAVARMRSRGAKVLADW